MNSRGPALLLPLYYRYTLPAPYFSTARFSSITLAASLLGT